MRPLSLAERALTTPTVSLSDLLTGERPQLVGTSGITLADYATEIARSGFPGIWSLTKGVARGTARRLSSTESSTTTSTRPGRAFVIEGHCSDGLPHTAPPAPPRHPFTTIHKAAAAGSGELPSSPTVAAYRRAIEQLWLIESVPAWLPTRNRLRRLASAPKHQLADPALALRCLGVDEAGLLDGQTTGHAVPRDGTLLGAMFESLVTLSLRVYAQANRIRVGHLRTHGGEHEVDLIAERRDGRVVALEVKLSATVRDRDVRHLKWLADRLGDDLLDAAVISTGHEAYRRQDGIGVIPAALLTA